MPAILFPLPEASHDLIETQERALLLCDLPQALEEAWLGLDVAAVAHHRLQDDSRNLALVLCKLLPHVVQVVVRCCQGGLCMPSRIYVSKHAQQHRQSTWHSPADQRGQQMHSSCMRTRQIRQELGAAIIVAAQ